MNVLEAEYQQIASFIKLKDSNILGNYIRNIYNLVNQMIQN